MNQPDEDVVSRSGRIEETCRYTGIQASPYSVLFLRWTGV